MSKVIERDLVSKDEIQAFVRRLGKQITHDYAGKEIFMIGILKGSFIFLADLVREIDLPCIIDFMSVSSYSGERSTGVVKIYKDVDFDITGKNVIIVEDIVDTGLTLNHLKTLLATRNPASVRLCTAFDKPSRRIAPIHVDYVGMEVPDEFVVGYGLDLDGYYRNYPEVVVLKDDPELEGEQLFGHVNRD